MKYETYVAFLSALMETKMSVTTRAAWQNYTIDDKDVPSCKKLLKFVDRRAKASERVSKGDAHKHGPATSSKRFSTRPSYTASMDEGDACIACE